MHSLLKHFYGSLLRWLLYEGLLVFVPGYILPVFFYVSFSFLLMLSAEKTAPCYTDPEIPGVPPMVVQGFFMFLIDHSLKPQVCVLRSL